MIWYSSPGLNVGFETAVHLISLIAAVHLIEQNFQAHLQDPYVAGDAL